MPTENKFLVDTGMCTKVMGLLIIRSMHLQTLFTSKEVERVSRIWASLNLFNGLILSCRQFFKLCPSFLKIYILLQKWHENYHLSSFVQIQSKYPTQTVAIVIPATTLHSFKTRTCSLNVPPSSARPTVLFLRRSCRAPRPSDTTSTSRSQ